LEKTFNYKEIDQEGAETLEAISQADAFNSWMYNTIRPYTNGKILELGSGIGNISTKYLDDGAEIMLSDIRQNYCDTLQTSFSDHKGLLGVEKIDLVHENFDEEYTSLFGRFDAAFALNVVEHIKDDKLAIHNAAKFLKKGGKLVILVPAYQALYNGFDVELEHYRRYNTTSLTQSFSNQDFAIIHKQYFNFAGIFGWYVSGKIMKNKIIPEGQMKLYDKLVPIFKIADKVILNKIGLSVICVGQKR
jgi:SAM-dependent methyltransferase